jgi:HK97 family phage portal protein
MSILSSIRDAFVGRALDLPQTNALSLVGEQWVFEDLNDPALLPFLSTGRKTSTGMFVNKKTMLKNSTGFRAVSLISSAIGMLPCHLYEKQTETRTIPGDPEADPPKPSRTVTSEGARRASDHPVYRLLHKKPNSFQTPFEFKSYMVQNALFHGIAYAVKKRKVSARSRTGFVEELIPLQPWRVSPKMSPDWKLHFEYNDPSGTTLKIAIEDMFWFRSPISEDGVTGVALLEVAAEALGLAHASERATGRVLANGAIVGGVLEHPKALSEPAIERLKAQFEERQSTPENAGKWLVAEDGLQAKPFGTTLKDAQNAELRKFQIEEMGRFTGIPRPLLMMDETSWGTGIEQLGLFLIMYCLMPWFISIEEAIWRSLLTEAEQDKFYAKFNEGALLRGSLKDQAEFFAKALGSGGGRGWLTQNEVREMSERNPMEGGDELPEPITKPASNGDKEDDPENPAPKPKPKPKGE